MDSAGLRLASPLRTDIPLEFPFRPPGGLKERLSLLTQRACVVVIQGVCVLTDYRPCACRCDCMCLIRVDSSKNLSACSQLRPLSTWLPSAAAEGGREAESLLLL